MGVNVVGRTPSSGTAPRARVATHKSMNQNQDSDNTAGAVAPAATCYAFERITNGFLAIQEDGSKVYLEDRKAVLAYIVGPIDQALDEVRHFEWDGKFTVTVGNDILA